jgi:hypothetical protein
MSRLLVTRVPQALHADALKRHGKNQLKIKSSGKGTKSSDECSVVEK